MTQLTIDVLNPDTYGNGDPARYGMPHDQYEYLRNEAPVYRQAIADPESLDEILVVSRYEDVMAIDRDAETWSSARGYLNVWNFNPIDPTQGGLPGMVTMDGADHRRNRKTISQGFTPNVVARFEKLFRSFAQEILDKAIAKGTFDFVEDVAVRMPLYAITDLLGVPDSDRDDFLGWVRVLAAPTDPNYAPTMDDMFAGFTALCQYGAELAERKRADPGEDLMSKVVQAHESEALDEAEMMGFVVLLAAAGSDTTRNGLAHGLHALMHHPEQMAYLRDNVTNIPDDALQEIVRFSTPIIHFNRTATRDTEIAGTEIKEGEKVAMLFPSANFDETVIADPHAFDLRRPNKPGHLAFGRGPHVCLGRHIAAIELKILFEELLQRTSSIEQAGEIHYVRDNFVRGVHSLPVTVARA